MGADEPGSRALWVGLGIGGAILAAVLLLVLFRGGDGPEPEAATSPAPAPVTPSAAGGSAPANDLDDEGIGGLLPPAPERTAADGARALEAALKGRRLWATVEVDSRDPAALVVRSGLCGEDEVREVIAETAPELTGLGITVVRCHERHGALAFEQPL